MMNKMKKLKIINKLIKQKEQARCFVGETEDYEHLLMKAKELKNFHYPEGADRYYQQAAACLGVDTLGSLRELSAQVELHPDCLTVLREWAQYREKCMPGRQGECLELLAEVMEALLPLYQECAECSGPNSRIEEFTRDFEREIRKVKGPRTPFPGEYARLQKLAVEMEEGFRAFLSPS